MKSILMSCQCSTFHQSKIKYMADLKSGLWTYIAVNSIKNGKLMDVYERGNEATT